MFARRAAACAARARHARLTGSLYGREITVIALSHVHDPAKRPLGDSLLGADSDVLVDVAVAFPLGHCRPGLPGLPHLIEHIVVALGFGHQSDWMGLTTPTTTTLRASVNACPTKLEELVLDLGRLSNFGLCGRDVVRIAREQAIEVRDELESLNEEQGAATTLLRHHWQAVADRERDAGSSELSGMAHLSVGQHDELMRCVDQAEAWLDHKDHSKLPLPLLFQQLQLVVEDGIFGDRCRWIITPAAAPMELTFDQQVSPRPRPTRGRRRAQLCSSSAKPSSAARRDAQEAQNTSLLASWLSSALASKSPSTTATHRAGKCLAENSEPTTDAWTCKRSQGKKGASLAHWARIEATHVPEQRPACQNGFTVVPDHGVREGEIRLTQLGSGQNTALLSVWIPVDVSARVSGDSKMRHRAVAWHTMHSQRLPVWGDAVTATARFLQNSDMALPEASLSLQRQAVRAASIINHNTPQIMLEPMVAPEPGYLAVLRLNVDEKTASDVCACTPLSDDTKTALLRRATDASKGVFAGVVGQEGRAQLMLQAIGELCGMAGSHVFGDDPNPIMTEEAVTRLHTALAGATLSSLGFPDTAASPDVRAFRDLIASAVVRAATGKVAAAEAVAQACAEADSLGDAEGFMQGLLRETPEYWSLEDHALDSLLETRVDAMQAVIQQVQSALSDPDSVQLDLYISDDRA